MRYQKKRKDTRWEIKWIQAALQEGFLLPHLHSLLSPQQHSSSSHTLPFHSIPSGITFTNVTGDFTNGHFFSPCFICPHSIQQHDHSFPSGMPPSALHDSTFSWVWSHDPSRCLHFCPYPGLHSHSRSSCSPQWPLLLSTCCLPSPRLYIHKSLLLSQDIPQPLRCKEPEWSPTL